MLDIDADLRGDADVAWVNIKGDWRGVLGPCANPISLGVNGREILIMGGTDPVGN